MKAEPSNQYDKNAYKVLVWKYDKFNHVGYVQRHSSSKIAAAMQGPGNPEVYNNRDVYVVGRLRNATGKPDMFEVEISGAIYDPRNLIKRDEAIKNDTGIFGGKKKPVKILDESEAFVKLKTDDWPCNQWVSKSYVRDQYGYVDYDIDADLNGYTDQADCF